MTRITEARTASLSFIIGTLVPALPFTYAVVVCAGFFAWIFFGSERFRRFFICMLFCAAGVVAFTLFRASVAPDIPPEAAVDLTGVVRLVETGIANQRAVVMVEEPNDFAGRRVLLYVSRYPLIREGVRVSVSCRLKIPEPFEGFRYDRYLERYRISYQCSYPRIEEIGIAEPARFQLWQFRQWYSGLFRSGYPEPVSSLFHAIALRQTRETPQWLLDDFTAAGVIHVVSISGLHVGVMILLLDELLIVARITRLGRFVGICLLTSAYMIMIGPPSSGVRSVLMALALFGARIAGRPYNGPHILIMTAALMAAVNPLLPAYDIGFQLSFAAFAGMTVLYPILKERLTLLPEQFGVRAMIALTVSAQWFTWPITAFYFGNISFASFFANILIVPLSSIMLIGALLAPLGAVPLVGAILRIPLFIISDITIRLTSLIAAIPGSAITVSFSATAFVGILGSMALCAAYLTKRKSP